MKHKPFGTIRSISWNNPYYNMLFQDCNNNCDAICYKKKKLKKM
jgi:hypothetical protein